ncbi:MAG: DNA polymerase Y family protein [Actinomycetota bacterium]|nr:DNA polymerase Y family protein [Actinomycetota bacterium]
MNTASTSRSSRQGSGSSRSLVVWCPDWPAVAAARQARQPATGPVAVFHANRVKACTAAARAEGIRVGMRRREAQSRCPELLVLPVDNDAAGRLFEPVVAAVEAVASGVEVLRPGMIACQVRGPRRYFGSENAAAERILDVVEALDVEARIGIADVLGVAVLAARQQRIVPVGGDQEFCAGLSIVELARDPAIAPPERADLIDLLIRLGITTVGAFAALPEERVATRFGPDALVAHRLAHGRAERGVSRRRIPEELAIEQLCDPPLDRVDTAAFLGRALAERFHAKLAEAGLACMRLAITARTTRGRTLQRVWRAARPLSPAATADRLRWQLDGWLTAGRRYRTVDGADTADISGAHAGNPDNDDDGPGGIVSLTLQPVEAVDAGRVQYGLWGSDGEDDHRAGWAFARVQGLLGPESVLSPVLSGGRSPADRITLVSWGDERAPTRDPAAPWPGALPAPSPTRLTDPQVADQHVELLDIAGLPVSVTARGVLSSSPALLDNRLVIGWAGPWLVDERWWEPHVPLEELLAAPPRYSARMQILCDPGPAVLASYSVGTYSVGTVQKRTAGQWRVEGVYD